jgi:type IV secretory pathway TraG/TraD family ATPase VirD4
MTPSGSRGFVGPTWWPDVLAWAAWVGQWKWWFLVGWMGVLCSFWALRLWWTSRTSPRARSTFATRRELRASGLLDGSGVPLGELSTKTWWKLWWHRSTLAVGAQQNVGIFGSKGCGKTVKIIVPYLLRAGANDESLIVFDPKRELVRLTRKHRESIGPTYMFAPGERQSDHINPWDWVRWGDRDVVDAQRLATHIARGEVEGQGQRPTSEEGQYYRRWARVLLWGSGLYLHDEDEKQRQAVGLSSPRCSFGGQLDFFSQPQASIKDSLDELAKSRDPIVRDVAALILNRTANDQKEVFSAAAGWLMDWFDPILAWSTHDTTVPIDLLQNGSQPMTLYLCFEPADLQGRLRPLARLLIDQLFMLMGRRGAREFHRRVRLVFEDMATLGYFPPAELAAEFYREAGADLVCCFQSMAQIRRHYGRDTSLWDNLDTWVVFRPKHHESAEFFAAQSGETTDDEVLTGTSRRTFGLTGQRFSRTVPYTHDLVTKEMLMGLDDDQHLVLVGGQTRDKHAVRPIIASGRPYFEEPAFAGLVP